MSAARDKNSTPTDDRLDREHEPDERRGPIGPPPRLVDLAPDSSRRIVRHIVTSTLERGVAPTAVIALYADIAGDEAAVRYADQRFMLREVPPDWHELENRVLDLEDSARRRGMDLAAAWRRAASVALPGQDAL